MPQIGFEAVKEEHRSFLFEVYAGTREEELRQTGWDETQQHAFLSMQFELQHRQYQQSYPNKDFRIILIDGQRAGRLYLDRSAKEIRIVDIALLPAFRGRGVGTRLLNELLAEGDATGRVVSIHVEKLNPALNLYRRLGFEAVADREVYWFMERHPPGATA